MNNLCQRDAWRVAGTGVAILLLLVLFLHWQTVLYLTGMWGQLEYGEYGHGYLVLLISAYLVFYNRHSLMVFKPCPEYKAIAVIAFVSMVLVVAQLVDIEVLQAAGLLLLVQTVVWALLGTQITLILAFPILFVSFAIPVWFPLTPLLQEITADSVFHAIRIINIPAMRIENMIVLPSGKLSIEEACAGLRYLMAALTLGTLYAYLNYRTFQSRLIVVLVSAGAAVLANILRVFIVVYLAFTSEMRHPVVQDHVFLGWALFGGLVALLLVIEAQLHRKSSRGSTVVMDDLVSKPCIKGKLQFLIILLVTAIFISAGPAIIFWKNKQVQSADYPIEIELPLSTEQWSGMDDSEDNWLPQYPGAIAHKVVYQDKDERKVHLYLGMYLVQTQGKELINDANRISDRKVWRSTYQKAQELDVNGQSVLEQLLERDDGVRRLVWYWYHVAGQSTINKYWAKVLQVFGLVSDKQQAYIIAIAARQGDDLEDAQDTLRQFTTDMGAFLIDTIDSVE